MILNEGGIMIVLTATMKAKEGSGNDLENIIKGTAPKFLKDPGCMDYKVHRRMDNADLFFFYEKYEDHDALAYHAATPHFKEMFAAMKPLLDGKAEILMYKEI
ncbi:MAG: antibiotic biosynthesis monooxygenase [Syntrophobacterales bacterium CG_4_8_14_3_um_filter_58_8]|nr:MAG: antibiotic biosynthesis monooxygenase [Syntrophobacterales bacterium CG03_land_8_20_14_0_80_58_14]PJC71806.1 MAG: antibiotic biosynthesis monooxygenase [Syntrophobacterales bacterium CG_4_8_14_3_um_filter_58_8]